MRILTIRKFTVISELACICGLLLGCTLQTPRPPSHAVPEAAAVVTESPHWEDAGGLMHGICFEAAQDAAGQVFIFRSPEQLAYFYDLADNSQLCRHPVARQSFDFSKGRVVVGLWSAGQGCTARHDLMAFERDNDPEFIQMSLDFITEGDCPYELVRPFWVAFEDAEGYEITVTVE